MARYSPTSVPTTGDIYQLERWLREEMEQIRSSTDDIYVLANFMLDNYVAAGYGGIGQDAATNPLPDIGAGAWIDFTGFDIPLVAPKAVSYDFANDGLQFNEEGIWYVSIKLALQHNELNAGRQIALRFDNRTTNTPGTVEFRYGVGRNTDVTNITLGVFFEVENAAVVTGVAQALGDTIGLEIGGGSAFSLIDCIGAIYEVHHISEYKGDFSVGTLESLSPNR